MANGDEMTTAQYLLFIAPFALTILIVFGMKYFSAAFQARVRIADEAAYRALADKAVAAQAENQQALSAMRADLAKLAASVAAVEKMLQQVG